MTRARIFFVLHQALGWKTYAAQIAEALARRDDVEAQTFLLELSRAQTLFLKRTNLGRFDWIYRRRDPIRAFHGALGGSIRAAIEAFDPSVVHFAGQWPAAAIERSMPSLPFTVTLDSNRLAIRRNLPNGNWNAADIEAEARLLGRAAHIFPMSQWASDLLVDEYGIDRRRVTVLPPSISAARFVRNPRKATEGPLRIVFIGNDFRRKGGDRLCRWVAGPLAGKAELHVVSGSPEASGQRPGVTFHGRVPNETLITELLPKMDVLCHPTQSDMSSLAVVEAAATGLASVASRIGGIPDLVRDGETGFLVAPGDDAGFVAALTRLAEDRELCHRLGENALATARRRFNAEANFDALIDQMIACQDRAAVPSRGIMA